MKLNNGQTYVHRTDGNKIKLLETRNGKWQIRFIDKKLQGRLHKMTAEETEHFLQNGYTEVVKSEGKK